MGNQPRGQKGHAVQGTFLVSGSRQCGPGNRSSYKTVSAKARTCWTHRIHPDWAQRLGPRESCSPANRPRLSRERPHAESGALLFRTNDDCERWYERPLPRSRTSTGTTFGDSPVFDCGAVHAIHSIAWSAEVSSPPIRGFQVRAMIREQ